MNTTPEDKRICWRCIGEQYLKTKVRSIGEQADCAYCAKEAKTVSILELSEYVRDAFERHYTRTPIAAPEHEEFMHRDGDVTWHREGDPAAEAIATAVKINLAPAEDVRVVLESNVEGTPDDYYASVGDDEEGEFSEEAHYEEMDADAAELHRRWEQCKTSLRTETRLFNSRAQEILDSIFMGLDGHATRAGRSVIVDAGPGQRIDSLYRARSFQSLIDLQDALKRPDLHLGPPPHGTAKAGRMNAHGIAIFYGARHAKVAIAEVRPPVGSHVLVGRFDIIKPLRLLDVEAFRSIFVKGSIFDPAYVERLKKAAFLSHLSKQIAQPIMPDEEPVEYLITQAIADYLATLRVPVLDGIIYRSVQHGTGRNNVALFHKSSCVMPPKLPPGTSVSASVSSRDEDGSRPSFWVFETVPDPDLHDPDEFGFPSGPITDDERRIQRETRNPTLSIDTDSIHVHEIKRATYFSEEFKVPRHRSQLKGIRRVR